MCGWPKRRGQIIGALSTEIKLQEYTWKPFEAIDAPANVWRQVQNYVRVVQEEGPNHCGPMHRNRVTGVYGSLLKPQRPLQNFGGAGKCQHPLYDNLALVTGST